MYFITPTGKCWGQCLQLWDNCVLTPFPGSLCNSRFWRFLKNPQLTRDGRGIASDIEEVDQSVWKATSWSAAHISSTLQSLTFSVPRAQDATSGVCPELNESSPHPNNVFNVYFYNNCPSSKLYFSLQVFYKKYVRLFFQFILHALPISSFWYYLARNTSYETAPHCFFFSIPWHRALGQTWCVSCH